MPSESFVILRNVDIFPFFTPEVMRSAYSGDSEHQTVIVVPNTGANTAERQHFRLYHGVDVKLFFSLYYCAKCYLNINFVYSLFIKT